MNGMSLTYVLVANAGVYSKQSTLTAYRFAKALIAKGHQLKSVFFYQDGVLNASSLVMPANDEFDLVVAWQKLAVEHGVLLETCVAAALRRGILSQEEAKQYGYNNHNLAKHFTQAGLGSLALALINADRVVQF